ncbi:MAG: CGNR zinc finger domain-containing protein [Candidatus Eiseniibacteriota bacterium]
MKDPFERPWHGIGTGGTLALDFANTLDWRLRKRPIELLKGYADLLRFARSAGVLSPAEARELRRWAEAHPVPAGRALAEAARVREAIGAVLQAIVDGRKPALAPLAQIEAACRVAADARSLRITDAMAAWTWRERTPEADRPAWAAALDAARILTTVEWDRVRQCGDAECGWFFLDTSRNGSRRWCSMKVCGNRNKARRFYRRSVKTKPK